MISIIIPAYNEAHTITEIILKIRGLYPSDEIIVVDDGSTDGTADVAQNSGAMVYRHPYNIGNGAAIKTGIRKARGDIVVFMDADGQHNPEDIGKLLNYMPEYDMVVGARNFRAQASVQRAVGNTLYNWLASYVAKFPIEDLTSGFRAIKTHIARQLIYLFPNTYSYPTTLTLAVLRSGRSVKYVPIQVQQRKSGKSGIRLVQDGVRFFVIITKICTLFSPMRIFLPVSGFMCISGLINYCYTFITSRRFTNMSAMLLITSVIIFMIGLVSEQICQMRYEKSEDNFEKNL